MDDTGNKSNAIGIIANPASGKDIRRLVSHATSVDNNEKVSIVQRIILAAQGCGVSKFYFMPDTFQIGYKVIDNLKNSKELKADVSILDMKINASFQDTVDAAEIMEKLGVGCIVVLGGDGSSRAAAKVIKNTPLIGVSTGTNNVYPQMIEGTIVGMAAAATILGNCKLNDICRKDKRIEVFKNGKLLDIALIDLVISKNIFIGARAIWDIDDMVKIIVSRCHPASIGFSAVAGCKIIVKEEDDFGVGIDLTNPTCKIVAPIAAGLMKEINIGNPEMMKINEEYEYVTEHRGVIALDGEREITFKQGEKFIFKITRNGPYHVEVRKVLELAQIDGFFNR